MRCPTLVACLILAAASAFAVDDTETTRQSFNAPAVLEVHNLNGLIRVTASNTPNIQLVATRSIHADNQADLDLARREVRLDVQQSAGRLRICVVHVWNSCDQNRDRGREKARDFSDRDISARYDLELQVPARTEIELKAINGRIEATGIQAPFRVSTVNGKVDLKDFDGSGSVDAVNGEIQMSFVRPPAAPVSAKTVNGTIHAAFPRTTNATLRFKTFRGEVFTDFPTPNAREFSVNIGSGGPEHRFETLNGEIQIAQR